MKSIVINLPRPYYVNCDYCINHYLRNKSINSEEFLRVCEKVLKEFPNATNLTITQESLKFNRFNQLFYNCPLKKNNHVTISELTFNYYNYKL